MIIIRSRRKNNNLKLYIINHKKKKNMYYPIDAACINGFNLVRAATRRASFEQLRAASCRDAARTTLNQIVHAD